MLLEVDAWVKARAAGITVPITISGVQTSTPLTVTWWNPEEHKRLMGDKRYCFLAIQDIGLRRDVLRTRLGKQHRLWRYKAGTSNHIAQVLRYPEAVKAQYQIALYAHQPRHARTLYPQLLSAYPWVESARISVDLYGDTYPELVPIDSIREDDIRETYPLEAERHIQAIILLSVRCWVFHRSPTEMDTFWNTTVVEFYAQKQDESTDTMESFSVVL